MGRRFNVMCGFLSMCVFFLCGTAFFLTGCGHYGNWWSLFAPVTIVFAVLVPAICYSYNQEDVDVISWDVDMELSMFKNCRDMGWVVLTMLGVFSEGIPAIVWYNEPLSLPWPGVLWIMSGIMLWWWTYAVLLRVFVFKS